MVDTHPGDAERLKEYWTHGEGAAKIRWGTGGDYDRCVRLVTEETKGKGLDVHGYCANLHHRALGIWPATHKKLLEGAAVKAATMPALVTLPGVDIVAAGRWRLASGEQTFTAADLRHAVTAAQCPAVGAPIIKIGHLDPRFDGEPALGRVTNMALAAQGNKITGDLAGLPGWLGAAMGSAYPRRSIEGTYDFKCQIGHDHPFVITGLALLGVTPPGVGVLSGLPDVAALYGVQAAAPTWRTEPGGDMTQTGVQAAAVTETDVRRAYYEHGATPQTFWITELQMDPAQLIVADEATSKVYRVPFHIDAAGAVSFDSPAEVSVTYTDLAAMRGTGPVVAYASAADSRTLPGAQDPPGDAGTGDGAGGVGAASDGGGDQGNINAPDAADLNTAARKYCASRGWAMPDGSYPIRDAAHHGETDLGKAIGAVGRGGGSHDAIRAHIMKRASALGKSDAIPDNWGAGGRQKAAGADPGIRVDAAGRHGAFKGTHTHMHAAMGAQGSDRTHEHSHTHDGSSGSHAHVHAAGASEGGKVDFTEEQIKALRSALGLGDEDELTPDAMVTAAGALREQADSQRVAASGPLPPGVLAIDQGTWDELNNRVMASERDLQARRRGERDQVIAAAITAGKFPPARKELYERMWDADSENARAVIASLRNNTVPMQDIGSPGGEFGNAEDDELFNSLFPPDYRAATARPGA